MAAQDCTDSQNRIPRRSPRRDLPALTSLRFFAALLVVVFHSRRSLEPLLPDLLFAPIAHGFVAVSFFFVLSGFILGYNYPSVASPPPFWRARFARIYPLYALSLVPGIAIMLKLIRVDFQENPLTALLGIASQFLGVSAWAPFRFTALNYPSWSLSVEFFFYLLFPLIVAPIAGGSRHRAGWIMAACLTVSFLISIVGSSVIADPHSGMGLLWFEYLKYGPLARLPEFIAGIALSRWLKDRLVAESTPQFPAATLLGLATTVAFLVLGGSIPVLVLHNSALVLPAMLLVGGLATENSSVRRILQHPWLVFGGAISYAMYILHFPIRAVLEKVAERVIVNPEHSLSFLGVYLLVVMVISAGAHLWIELPMQRRLRGPAPVRTEPHIPPSTS